MKVYICHVNHSDADKLVKKNKDYGYEIHVCEKTNQYYVEILTYTPERKKKEQDASNK